MTSEVLDFKTTPLDQVHALLLAEENLKPSVMDRIKPLLAWETLEEISSTWVN